MTLIIKSLSHSWSGSSVLSIWGIPEPIKLAEGHSISVSMRGSAAIVELPSNPIFLTLHAVQGQDLTSAAVQALDSSAGPGNAFLDAIASLASSRAVGRSNWLPDYQWPLIVAFHDIAKPDSVYRVTNDNISLLAGERAEIVGVRLEVVTDQSSDKLVRKRLPWLRRNNPQSVRLPQDDLGDALHPKVMDPYVGSDDFSTEIFR